jgi:exonuclease SbcC
MKLEINNFQAIRHGILEFPVGITTIVGASNSGKTSIVRAITSLITNPSEAKTYITHGESKTSVNMIYRENNILWERTEKDSFYKINEVQYQKVGRTDLFELLPDNGFQQGDNHDILNIEDEYSYLFPFSSTDSQIYKIFESAFAINNSTEVLQKIKVDESFLKKEIAEMNSNLTKTRIKVDKISNFLINNNPTTLLSKKEKLEVRAISLSDLNKNCESISKNIIFIEKYDNIEEMDFDLSILDKYSKLCEDTDFINKNIKLADSNLELKEFNFKLFNDYFKLEKDCNFILKNIKSVNKIIDLKDYGFETFYNYFKLEEDVKDILKLIDDYKRLDTEGKELQTEIQSIGAKLKEIGTCPLCNQQIREDIVTC